MADSELPAIYCVHLPSSTGRRERMERRFRHHRLERATLVRALEIPLPRDSSDEWKAMAGRYAAASHLKAMRRILDEVPESEGGAIICEDDVLFHNEFEERLPGALANLPSGAGALLLGFMVVGWPERLRWSGRDPEQHNLVPVVPWETWGAHGYWITHEYAAELVDTLGVVPVEELSNVVEAQLTFGSGGHCAYPPLMLQETVDSVVRPEHELPAHVTMQAAWPYVDYAAAEAEPAISPLADLPDPRRTISLRTTATGEGYPVDHLQKPVDSLVVQGESDYVLTLDPDMQVEWLGPLPPLTADAYRVPVAGAQPVTALVRSGLALDDAHEIGDLHSLVLKRGILLNDLVPAMFASHEQPLDLEGVTLGVVEMDGGGSLALERDDHGLNHLVRRDGDGTTAAISPGFRFSDHSTERPRGIAVADDMLVFGFDVDERLGGLAACELEAALGLLRPARGPSDLPAP